LPARVGLFLALILVGPLSAGCGGGGGEETTVPPATTPAATSPATGEGTVGIGQAETMRDVPFALNTEQPVPPDFKEAYQRRALIAVQFYKVGEDPFYPQGLGADERVRASMERLRAEYPTIEFFTYDIDNPGTTEEGSEGLESGQYGTLAAQLGVGFTPFVAMLAPSGEQYVITNLFQGYVPRPVLSQALFDLSAVQVETNTSDVDVVLEQIELTESGGGIEYFTVENGSRGSVNLQNFSLQVLDPETGEVTPDSPGITINEAVEVRPGQSVSIGRVPDVVDADGERVVTTFEGGEALELSPGDQVALLDSGGAVASTYTM
jgi:hypothetical protein